MQERFLTSYNISAKNQKYWIPLTWTTSEELNFTDTEPRIWLNKDDLSINIDKNANWYILNIREIGFYRVNYDKNNWIQLINVLNGNNFTQILDVNRAQLIDDSLNLARAGYIDYDIALNLSKYLTNETNYLPWKSMTSASAYLNQRIEGDAEIKKLYNKYALQLVEKAYNEYGFNEDMEKDSLLHQLTRELVLSWACRFGHKDCIKQAKEYFRKMT